LHSARLVHCGGAQLKPLPTPRACIFDLDGTLVDSLEDIAQSINHCLTLLGLPTRPVSEYRYLVGEGVPRLCQKAIGESAPHLVPRLTELGRAVYRTRILDCTRPYPGVPELITRLRARGIPLAVLSNKPHELTCRIIRRFWPDDAFACVQGYTIESERKPSPHHALRIATQLGVSPADLWIIGDTSTDVATATASGAVPIGVTWGFRPREELAAAGARLIVDRPEELG